MSGNRTFVRNGVEIEMKDVRSGDEIYIYEEDRLIYRVIARADGIQKTKEGQDGIFVDVEEAFSYTV